MSQTENLNIPKTYQICAQCVMDTSDPEILFNGEGICSHCQSYEAKKAAFTVPDDQKESQLNFIIDFCKKKGRGKKYDCIIGVSGGVDSTYLAWLVKHLGLRPLAVHLDNGWNSELAVSNIKGVLAKLGIDLYTYVIDWEEFKSLQLAFLKASTPDSEIPSDHAIGALMRNIAAKEGVPLLWGSNFSSESILPRSWSQGHMDWGYINNVNRLFGERKLRTFPHYSVWKLIYYRRIKLQQTFEVLNCIDYDKEKAKRFLLEELGWKDYGDKHHESIYTRIFQSYILPVKFGYDKRRAHYSSLILSGQMKRDEAIELLNGSPYNNNTIKQDIDYLVKKFQITSEQFEEIMHLPPRKYDDLTPALPRLIIRLESDIFSFVFASRRWIISKTGNLFSSTKK